MRLLMLLPFVLLVASACAAMTHNPRASQSWVWILTGPRDTEVQGEERRAAFAGHFANMKRMATEGELLISGPFGEPRVRDDHRGVFLLATDDLAHARQVANTDPTAQAGVFVFEVERFETTDALERVSAMHAAALVGVDNPPPGYHCRPYVLVTGQPAASAERALAEAPVLFGGRIGAGADVRALACLDATTADEAQAHLPDEDDVQWTVMPWFATEEISNLRGTN